MRLPDCAKTFRENLKMKKSVGPANINVFVCEFLVQYLKDRDAELHRLQLENAELKKFQVCQHCCEQSLPRMGGVCGLCACPFKCASHNCGNASAECAYCNTTVCYKCAIKCDIPNQYGWCMYVTCKVCCEGLSCYFCKCFPCKKHGGMLLDYMCPSGDRVHGCETCIRNERRRAAIQPAATTLVADTRRLSDQNHTDTDEQ